MSDSCRGLCSRQRPLDFRLPGLETFSTVHLSSSLCFSACFCKCNLLGHHSDLLLKVPASSKVVHKILWRRNWGHEKACKSLTRTSDVSVLKNHWLCGLWAAAVSISGLGGCKVPFLPASKWLFPCDQCLLPKSTNPCLLLCQDRLAPWSFPASLTLCLKFFTAEMAVLGPCSLRWLLILAVKAVFV